MNFRQNTCFPVRPERSAEGAKSKGPADRSERGEPFDSARPERNEVKPKGSGRTVVVFIAQQALA